MGNNLVSPNVVPLLQGLKPYLGNSGQTLAESVVSLLQLLTSPQGQEAVHTMSKVIGGSGKSDKTFTINTVGGGTTGFSLNLAFTLFLILILLILSGNLLALDFTGTLDPIDPVDSGAGDTATPDENVAPVPEGTLI